ncbi:MAG: 50S ribosomal protein L25 [Patescibacteria group bacterium]|nr:50S ribosomal protein L25 [Patescibacteria group bacterium]
METLTLNATIREVTGNQVKALRREGQVPAIVYGAGMDNLNVSLEAREIKKMYSEIGESALVDLVIDGKKPVKILIQSVQYHPVRHEIIHVDLRAVKMDEKIEAFIEFDFVGEAPAVKAHGAIFIRNMDGINVKCLPTDLVQSIEVDLDMLKEFGDTISVGDITPPSGIEFLAEATESIALASEPRVEEEPVAAEAEEGVDAVKVVGEEKKAEEGDEAEKAEGEQNAKQG